MFATLHPPRDSLIAGAVRWHFIIILSHHHVIMSFHHNIITSPYAICLTYILLVQYYLKGDSPHLYFLLFCTEWTKILCLDISILLKISEQQLYQQKDYKSFKKTTRRRPFNFSEMVWPSTGNSFLILIHYFAIVFKKGGSMVICDPWNHFSKVLWWSPNTMQILVLLILTKFAKC